MTTPTQLRVTAVRAAAQDVVAVDLALPDGGDLPAWRPGAHIELRLPSGRLRQYSLCGDPADVGTWRIGVLREPRGRGGSVELHELARPGALFMVRGPRNHFPLTSAPSYLFLAGGIGVTPILAMVRAAAGRGTPFTVVYGGRTRSTMAFADELTAVAGDALTLLPQDEAGLPDLPRLLGGVNADTAVHACGPAPMLAAVERECARLGLADRLHLERFTAGDDLETAYDAAENRDFDVQLARTGGTLTVPADRRLIEVLRDAVPGLSYDCEKGYCGACETRVLGGTPEHRDSVLSEEERRAGRTMMICVGRCRGDRLVLDL
ncbi:PDR/VanB family oxidoreductase [Streptomyces sp. NPDC048523]|uniref:PDR/VanB family oxidoreductase n=1 Tax=Streptomyces sp. NPDC048523 TaxID=3365567 RepID=UPI0037199734